MTSCALFLVLFLLGSSVVVATSSSFLEGERPTSITLHAGVLNSPPFSFIKEDYNPLEDDEINNHLKKKDFTRKYGGFLPHLLQRLQVFAKQVDDIDLTLMLDSPTQSYDGAINLIANDCVNTTLNDVPISYEDCQKYDFMIADFWGTPTRFERVDFSPPWLRTTMSVMKYTDDASRPDHVTLQDAFRADDTVCALGDSIIIRTARWS